MKKIATIPLARPAIASLCLSLCLAACGGDGDNPQSAGSPSGGISSGVSGGVSSGYSISGVVSGLASGFSLQLLNNGAAPLTLTANGAFTFAAPVALNSAYAVTIGTQPLGQTCSVSSGSGVATAAVTNVTISCGAVQARVSTLAGSTTAGSADGTGTAASFKSPFGVALDASGNLYVADTGNSEIRMITRAGVVTTLAGSTTAGSADGTGAAASFWGPTGIAVDASGNVYVGDSTNNRIRKITPAGVVATLAGTNTRGSTNGSGAFASFSNPHGVAVDASGNVYVADSGNNQIRKITPAGNVTTLAGSSTAGFANGTGVSASFSNPIGVAVDASGNVYVADTGNNAIRMITPAGVVTTLAGSGATGFVDATGTAAAFNSPYAVAVDSSGNVYVTDNSNNVIRKVTAAGVVTTLAGSSTTGSANGYGTAATFWAVDGIAVDTKGTVYVADANNNQIRLIQPTQ
ncbi:NHL repeat-containing protein [Cupriavidus basilensis]